MGKMEFPHPVPVEQVPILLEALESGRLVDVGQVSFVKDRTGVWGTDAYGVDFFLSSNVDAEKLLKCSDAHHNANGLHPAECCY